MRMQGRVSLQGHRSATLVAGHEYSEAEQHECAEHGCGALTAVLSCANAGCWRARASSPAGARILAMRFTAVARFTTLNRCKSRRTTASMSCETPSACAQQSRLNHDL